MKFHVLYMASFLHLHFAVAAAVLAVAGLCCLGNGCTLHSPVIVSAVVRYRRRSSCWFVQLLSPLAVAVVTTGPIAITVAIAVHGWSLSYWSLSLVTATGCCRS